MKYLRVELIVHFAWSAYATPIDIVDEISRYSFHAPSLVNCLAANDINTMAKVKFLGNFNRIFSLLDFKLHINYGTFRERKDVKM